MLRASRLLPLVSLLALAGCPGPRTAGDHALVRKGFIGCLPLPGTSRSQLRLGPDRKYLYWTEQVRLAGYDDTWPSTEVVRWPLDGGQIEPLTNLLDNPYRVLSDGRLVGLNQGYVGVWSPWGSERVSMFNSINHLELLAGQDAVVYQVGESLWRQPLRREGSRRLAEADTLLGVDGDSVVVRFQDPGDDGANHLRLIDGATGKATELPWLDGVIKAVPSGLIVQTNEGVGVRAPAGGAVKTVLPGDSWQVGVGPDVVRAWRKVGQRLEGAIVTTSGADMMPSVVGGDSLEGFVRVPDGRIAYLVGYDLDGDGEVTSSDEMDVCLAAADAKEVRVEPRVAPARWSNAGGIIAAFVKETLGSATWHFGSGDAVPALYVDAAPPRKDEAAIRADIRGLADKMSQATGDHTLYARIGYSDGKRGVSEWWARTGRRVAWAGTGGAIVPDLADYDVTFKSEFKDGAVDDDDSSFTTVRCSGTVTNQSDHLLVDLWADCIDGGDDAKIRVVPHDLAPGQVGRFDDNVRRNGDALEAVSIHSGPGYVEVPNFDLDRYARLVQLDALAADIADRTDLLYMDSDDGTGQVTVHVALLAGKTPFARSSGQAQEQAAASAQDRLEKADPALFGGKKGDTIRLKITENGQTWWYEDGELRLDTGD